MANQEHIEWLQESVKSWNRRRKKHDFQPDFNGADLHDSICFEERNLRESSFHNANLSGVNLKNADLEFADLQEANLFEASLDKAKLINADFDEAFLSLATLIHVDASGASFAGAYLRDADLRHGKFVGADFTNANLAGANIEGADFSQADFTNASLAEANIKNANFSKAVLAGVADITNTYPWKSILFPATNLFPARKKGKSKISGFKKRRKKIKSVENLVKKCRILKNHYKAEEADLYFNEYCLFYFRGERKNSWELRPSVTRDSPEGKINFFQKKESEMLMDLMSRRPEDFARANSAISQWVIAQHHGLTTRLLDVTRNPLVALFHACEERYSSDDSDRDDGVLHVFAVPRRLVKAFDSDAISIIANMAKLPWAEQDMLMGWLEPEEFESMKEPERLTDYPLIMDRLYHHIRSEKPYFKQRIDIRDFFRVFVVEPKQMFERIKVQSGAFLISAFHKRFETDQILKLNKNTPVYHHYKLTVPAGEKKNILEELELLNIRREILFPGLDEAATAVVKHNEYDE